MEDKARQALNEIIQKYGPQIVTDHRRVQGLLSDYCGEQKRAKNLMLSALHERIPDELLGMTNGLPPELTIDRLSKKLEEMGFSPEDSCWSVETWALALGKINASQCRVKNLQSSSTPSSLKNVNSETLPTGGFEPGLTAKSSFNTDRMPVRSHASILPSILIGLCLGGAIAFGSSSSFDKSTDISKSKELQEQLINSQNHTVALEKDIQTEKSALEKLQQNSETANQSNSVIKKEIRQLISQKEQMIQTHASLENDLKKSQEKQLALLTERQQFELELQAIEAKKAQTNEKKAFLQSECNRLQESLKGLNSVRLNEEKLKQEEKIRIEREKAKKEEEAKLAKAEQARKKKEESAKSKKTKSQPKIVQNHEEPYESPEVRVLPPAPVRTVIPQQIVPAAPAQKKPLAPTRPNIGTLWNQAGNASKEIYKKKGF